MEFLEIISFLDYPRFKHRGILVDTARHFLPMDTLYEVLEGMSMNKFNVMHWHIVDEQRLVLKCLVSGTLKNRMWAVI